MTHMFYFVYEVARVDETTPAPAKIFAGCWINQGALSSAGETARRFIEEQGLEIVQFVEGYPITRDHYDESPEGLEYFEQALTDGEVMVLFESLGLGEREDLGPGGGGGG